MPDGQKGYATGAIVAGLVGTFGATLVGSAEGITNISSLTANFVQVGAPCMAGFAISQLVMPVDKEPADTKGRLQYEAKAGLIGGAGTAAVLIIAGALPATFDMQLVSFVVLAGVAVFAGEYAVRYAGEQARY